MTKDLNKGIEKIEYNNLNLPSKVLKTDGQYIKYSYDAVGVKHAQEVYDAEGKLVKKTLYRGELIYEQIGDGPMELKMILHEEGRVVVDETSGEFEYHYHVKDHLGNARVTFTSKPKTHDFPAGFESENSDKEESFYANITETRVTFNSADANNDGGDEVVRLNGSQPVGPGISLSVGAGDEIDMEVYGYYEGGDGYSAATTAGALVTAVAGAFGGMNGTTGYEQATYDAFEGAYNNGMVVNGSDDDYRPAVYLNYILFDENMVYYKHGHTQISTNANMNHEKLSIENVVVEKAGFAYVYVSNESVASGWVYLDDMEVTVREHEVLETADYYAFGMQHAGGFRRVTAEPVRFKFNGKERITDLDLEWYDFHARMYDPVLGRTWQMDPHSDSYYDLSPYSWAANNPLTYLDPDGQDIIIWYENEDGKRQSFRFNGNNMGDAPDNKFVQQFFSSYYEMYDNSTGDNIRG